MPAVAPPPGESEPVSRRGRRFTEFGETRVKRRFQARAGPVRVRPSGRSRGGARGALTTSHTRRENRLDDQGPGELMPSRRAGLLPRRRRPRLARFRPLAGGGRIVAFCPETAAACRSRPAAEIAGDSHGFRVKPWWRQHGRRRPHVHPGRTHRLEVAVANRVQLAVLRTVLLPRARARSMMAPSAPARRGQGSRRPCCRGASACQRAAAGRAAATSPPWRTARAYLGAPTGAFSLDLARLSFPSGPAHAL
jgi:hypothetical protein